MKQKQNNPAHSSTHNDCRDVTCYVSTAATASRLSILFLVLWLMPLFAQAANVTWNSGVPPTVADGDNVTISGTPTGTLTVPANTTVR